MLDNLLPYYNQELSYIRELADEFSKVYPKVASQLSISSSKIEDPDVARLIESFAFLTAHIRYKLEDDFPEVAESLLSILHPNYLTPIPAFSVIQFKPKHDMLAKYVIPKNALLETEPSYSEHCRFTTLYPVELWPITILKAKFSALPFKAPILRNAKDCKSIIHLTLKYDSIKMQFKESAPGSLKFFLSGRGEDIYPLYKLIFSNVLSIALANSPDDKDAIFIDKSNIKAVGFDLDDSFLPNSAHVAQGYDLLTEYFTFPEKFLFFELAGLDEANLTNIENRLEIFFYLNEVDIQLEKNMHSSMFKLGCSPIVNLFPHTPEPINLSNAQSEFKINPDVRKTASSLEIFSIKKVSAINTQGDEVMCDPFFSIKHRRHTNSENIFWHVIRRENSSKISDIYLAFSDIELKTITNLNLMIHLETLCTNGDAPSRLPFGGGEPFLLLNAKGAPVQSIACLIPFSFSLRPKLRNGMLWKLVSNLSLNYLSIARANNATDLLKEILRIYDFKDSIESENIIESIMSVTCKSIAARGPKSSHQTFCQGTEVSIKINEQSFVGSGLFLFAKVLNNFLARYATLNSFTQLVILTSKGDILFKCMPRTGNKALL